MRNILVRLQNLITRVRVDRPGGKPQVAGRGDAVYSDREVFEPQGVHFVAAADAQGVQLSPDGQTSAGIVVGLGGQKPADGSPGEGGLHLLGTYKIYLALDGKLHLGAKDPGDFVALASKVDAAIATLSAATAAGFGAVTAPGGGPAALAAFNAGAASVLPSGSTEVKCL